VSKRSEKQACGKVAGNVGYYPTLPSRMEEYKEIAKGDNSKETFLQ